jgi:hypothetical protein
MRPCPETQRRPTCWPATCAPQVPNVALGGCRTLRALVDSHGAAAGQREVSAVVSDLAPLLVDLIGDSNPRLNSNSSELIVHLASSKHCGLQALVRRMPVLACKYRHVVAHVWHAPVAPG